MRKRLNSALLFTILCCTGLFLGTTASGQTKNPGTDIITISPTASPTPPPASSVSGGTSSLNCNSTTSCTSKDLSVVGISAGNTACATCGTGNRVTYPFSMTIHNGTKSERASFILYGTLSAGAQLILNGPDGIPNTQDDQTLGDGTNATNIYICVGPITVKQGDQTFSAIGQITFTCGQNLTLSNNYMAWTDASDTTAERCGVLAAATSCADIAPKCGTAASITIRQPLSVGNSATESCDNSATGSVTVTPVGGTGPYVIVIDGTSTSNATTATKTPLGGGSYTCRVTDAAGCTATALQTVSTHSCCTIPTVTGNPSGFSVCDVIGNTATFSASATGTPTPTIQWQAKPPAGSFGNISNGTTYSGVTTNTLTVLNVHGLNGYQFKAVFTSGTCDPASSTAGTLTLYSVPPSPHAVAQPITDPCSTSTYCVLVDNVVANATYRIRDAAGATFGNTITITPSDAIHTTSTANITFCGIPAGTGFTVNVVSDNNCAPSDAPLPCGSTITRKAGTTTTVEINDGGTPTSVKAYPNPFSDRVKFLVTSSTAGRGSLEVYNMMGQKIKTVYQGFIASGTQTFELSMPRQQIANLVYVLRVGDKKMSGKLLQINQ